MDLTALRDELAADPQGLGYTGSDVDDAARLNERGASGETLLRKSIPMGEIYAQVEWTTEWADLTGVFREGFRQITSTETLDASSPRIRAALEAIFGTGSNTWANLAAIATRDATRAEILFGHGVRVTPSHCADARRL